MAATLSLGPITLGCGQPHIIVSVMGRTEEEIFRSAQNIAAYPEIALAEWRADYFCDAQNPCKTLDVLQKIRVILPDKPLIYTLRTTREGGKAIVSANTYMHLCQAVAASHLAEVIDVEMFFEGVAQICTEKIHALGGHVIGSWHDFEKTPGQNELLQRFEHMRALGADILKMAVMPKSHQDVLTLMAAAKEMHQRTDRPLCAISMGETGSITRTTGETFGSCLTFGALDALSAPGQIPVQPLYEALCTLHKSLQNAR